MSKQIGPFIFHPDRGRSTTEFMGRFGGGWNYRLGFTAGTIRRTGFTVLVSLLVREYRIEYRPRKKVDA